MTGLAAVLGLFVLASLCIALAAKLHVDQLQIKLIALGLRVRACELDLRRAEDARYIDDAAKSLRNLHDDNYARRRG